VLCEQKASEDTTEVRRPSSREEELSPPDTQFFESQVQPRASTPFAETTQACQSQKSASTCDTPASNLAQCQQPSQASEAAQQQKEQESNSQNSNGGVIDVENVDDDDDDDVTVSYPLPPGSISSLNQIGSPNPAGSQDRPLDLTQDSSKSPFQASTQSSRTTLGGNSSTKIASQSTTGSSTRSDLMSPPLLP
jgi:hypothetical protein